MQQHGVLCLLGKKPAESESADPSEHLAEHPAELQSESR